MEKNSVSDILYCEIQEMWNDSGFAEHQHKLFEDELAFRMEEEKEMICMDA